MISARYNKLKLFDHLNWIKLLRHQITLVSLAIASSFLFIFTQIFIPEIEPIRGSSTQIRFAVIVDCGSSGTRAHLFRWDQDPRTNPIDLVLDSNDRKPLTKHVTPGLSSFHGSPEKAFDYIEPIMRFISNSIPSDRHLDTPIYFLATAGMRFLKESTQKKIFNVITRGVRANYNFPRVKSEVISGSQEGVYSWLSLNKDRRIYNSTSESKSYGMIEVGGASVQVTFELDQEVENRVSKELLGTEAAAAFSDQQVPLVLASNNSLKLFSTTFLGLGVNSAREATVDLFVLNHLNATEFATALPDQLSAYKPQIQDPCLSIGYSEIVRRPTALLRDKSTRGRSIGFVIGEQEETFEVDLRGTGDFLECMNLLDETLKRAHVERLNCPARNQGSTQTCPMSLLGTGFIPFNFYPFIGLSEMFFTTNEMIHSAGLFDRAKVLHETKRVCSASHSDLIQKYKGSVTWEDRIVHECFKACWLLTLLHESGLKMPSDYNNFRTVESLDGSQIDWTFGAIIKEVALKII